jgi:hypothetical protein
MDRDAYPDDMARFLRLSDEDVERIFRGLPPEGDEDLRDLAGFLADAAETLSRPPRGEVRATHLSLLAGAIRTPSAGLRGESSGPAAAAAPIAKPTERSRPMRSPVARWAAKVTVVAATLVVTTAALALAGVDLPGTAAETAFQKVLGVELPNQAQDAVDPARLPEGASDTAGRVLTVIHDRLSGAAWNGCEFGAAVSAAAQGLEGEPDTSHCEAAEEKGAARSPADGGAENAEHAGAGLDTAAEASGDHSTEGAGHADEGLESAGEAPVDPPAADEASIGLEIADGPPTPGAPGDIGRNERS